MQEIPASSPAAPHATHHTILGNKFDAEREHRAPRIKDVAQYLKKRARTAWAGNAAEGLSPEDAPSASARRTTGYDFFRVPRRAPRLGAAAFFSRPGHSMLGQSFQGPRAVVTTTSGAPQSGQVSPVASSLPRAGSG